MVGSDHEISIHLRVNSRLWKDFQERCTAQKMLPDQVLVGLIKIYLTPLDHQVAIAVSSDSDTAKNPEIKKIIEDYLQQNLEPQILEILEHYPDSKPNHHPSTNNPPTAKTPKSETKTPNSTLKTGKELAKLLGVSPPYITTLNRIGELPKWGWQDSGQRRGKTILYEPISPP